MTSQLSSMLLLHPLTEPFLVKTRPKLNTQETLMFCTGHYENIVGTSVNVVCKQGHHQ